MVLSRIGNLEEDLTVNYTIGGDATNGVDYRELSGSIVIPAGKTLVTLPILPFNDNLVEGLETVEIELVADSTYQVGTHGIGEVNIIDDDGFIFPTFEAEDVKELNLVGDAQLIDNKLNLNLSEELQKGAAWYNIKQSVADGFETTFQFQISDLVGSGGDGFAFVIQNNNPTALVGAGGSLGYGGLSNSLAIEFDTLWNPGNDPNANHISVHTNGTLPNGSGSASSLGFVDTIPDLSDGNVHTAKIAYTPGTLEIYLNDLTTPVLTVPLDLENTLNLDNGTAYLGFTGTTGAAVETHDILNWMFETETVTETTQPTIFVNPANGNQYFFTELDTWLGAQEQAQALGGNLVTINDADEEQWLRDTFGNSWWFGLTDSPIYGATEGNYQFLTGEPIPYFNWAGINPNNDTLFTPEGEDFGEMGGNGWNVMTNQLLQSKPRNLSLQNLGILVKLPLLGQETPVYL